jgi:hypothetical protein
MLFWPLDKIPPIYNNLVMLPITYVVVRYYTEGIVKALLSSASLQSKHTVFFQTLVCTQNGVFVCVLDKRCTEIWTVSVWVSLIRTGLLACVGNFHRAHNVYPPKCHIILFAVSIAALSPSNPSTIHGLHPSAEPFFPISCSGGSKSDDRIQGRWSDVSRQPGAVHGPPEGAAAQSRDLRRPQLLPRGRPELRQPDQGGARVVSAAARDVWTRESLAKNCFSPFCYSEGFLLLRRIDVLKND